MGFFFLEKKKFGEVMVKFFFKVIYKEEIKVRGVGNFLRF